ncbi:uncharacterized protein G2W53_005488 [Senna tora]|uniref:Uncharacterized protein n=1 Tax=Senna tora TaxID=362788 RepID=A0A834X2K1_9FABA|nr:uncharacterized protein G2W53_005488 [Senna tora]
MENHEASFAGERQPHAKEMKEAAFELFSLEST